MTTKSNTFDGGVDGASVTLGGSGGASGDAFDALTVNTGGSLTYDASQSATGCALRAATTWQDAKVGYDLPGTARRAGRFDVYLSAGVDTRPLTIIYNTFNKVQIIFGSNGAVLVFVAPSTAASAPAGTLPTGRWFSVEYDFVFAGSRGFTVIIYSHTYGRNPLAVLTPASDPFYGDRTAGRVWLGVAGDYVASLLLDNVSVNDDTPISYPLGLPVLNTPARILLRAGAPTLPPPPMLARMRLRAPAPAITSLTESPPVAVARLRAVVPAVYGQLRPGPARILLRARASLSAPYGLSILAPADGATVPTTRPTAVVMVGIADADIDAAELLVRATFVRGDTTVTLTAVPTGMGLPVTFTPDDPLPTGSASVTVALSVDAGGTWLTYQPSVVFTINTGVGSDNSIGSVTVDAGLTAAPTLLLVDPPAADVGQDVTAYAVGLPAGTVTAELAGTPATVTAVARTLAAAATAYTADRLIDPAAGRVDPEHDEVTLTVPDADAPGGPLTLEVS